MPMVRVPARDIVPASHTAVVERRTQGGGGFYTLGPGEAVRPREAIRLAATNVDFQSFNPPEFIIQDSSGQTVFRADKAASTLTGQATMDIAAPMADGDYILIVHAQSFPFLPITHSDKFPFSVSRDAPPPMSAPPKGGFFADLEKLLKTGGILLIGVAGLVLVTGLRKEHGR